MNHGGTENMEVRKKRGVDWLSVVYFFIGVFCMEIDLREKELTGKVIGAAIEVHRILGAGFLES